MAGKDILLPGETPPACRGWDEETFARHSHGPNAECPVCHRRVYYFAGPRGRGAFFDSFGPPWDKHPCAKPKKKDAPAAATAPPKSKKRADLKRSGWLPFYIQKITARGVDTLIRGVRPGDALGLRLFVAQKIKPDRELPAFIRAVKRKNSRFELFFFPVGNRTPIAVSAVQETKELLASIPRQKTSSRAKDDLLYDGF